MEKNETPTPFTPEVFFTKRDATVEFMADDKLFSIEVFGPDEDFGQARSRINAPATGSLSAQGAQAFAIAFQRAIEVAAELENRSA